MQGDRKRNNGAIALSAASTGGHVYPLKVIDEELMHDIPNRKRIYFLHSSVTDIAGEGKRVNVSKMGSRAGRNPFRIIMMLTIAFIDFQKSLFVILRNKPSVMVCFGGFSSVMPAIAAYICGVPVVVQEQNSYPGKANMLVSKFAKTVFAAYPKAVERFGNIKGEVFLVANPVRKAIFQANSASVKHEARKIYGIGEDAYVIGVFGGSRGSRRINNAVAEIIENSGSEIVSRNIFFLHITGKAEFKRMKERITEDSNNISTAYKQIEYEERMELFYAASDIIVSRAGAMTVSEIEAVEKPCVLIPYPYATEDHQRDNAATLESRGFALIIDDSELDGASLERAITKVMSESEEMCDRAKKKHDIYIGFAREFMCRRIASIAMDL